MVKATGPQNSPAKKDHRLSRESHDLPIVTRIAQKALLTNEIEPVRADVQDYIEKRLGILVYALLILDQRSRVPLFISHDISSALLEEITRASFARNFRGPFEEGTLTLTGLPLLESDEVASVLIARPEEIESLAPDNVAWLKLIATQLLLAEKQKELDLRAEKLLVAKEALDLSSCDYFKKQLVTEWERARRYNRCLSLVLLDIDDFGTYKEAFGAEWKELALAEISQLIKKQCRQSDIVASYMGDELAVILPETDVSGGFVAAERIRESISRFDFMGQQNERDVKLTASLGVVGYPLNTADLESLAREAESALYKAKTTGRNRVCGPELPA